MDIEAKFNLDMKAKIRKDYSALNNCVEYKATVILCWGKGKYEEQKETLQHFLSLREKGKVPAYITPEHMKDWIMSEGRNILRERFQREGADQKDGLIHLVWEVNMRLKMQDIYRELGLTTSSSTPLSDGDTQRAALSDLQSSVMAETRHISIFPECYFDPDAVVWRAVREIIQELARLPVTRQHSLSEVVVDTVTSLFRTVMDDGEEPSNQTESSRPLSGVAVGATVTVLQDVHAVACRATQEFPMQYSHSAGKGMVSALHRELLEQMGSPEALKVAMRRKHDALSSTITTAITAAIGNLLTPPDATSPAMLLELQEYDIAAPTDLDVLEVQQQLNETELDIATDTKTALDIAITMETLLDIVTSVQTVDRAASVEHLRDVVESVKPQLDLVEPSEMQDGCVMENAEILLDNAEGDDSQLEDLPQKVKKQKKGIQNFFSRMWKTLKDSALCCCCCCCVSLESE